MKNYLILLLGLLLFALSCKKEEMMPEDTDGDPSDPMEEIIDTIDLDFINLQDPALPDFFLIRDMIFDQDGDLWLCGTGQTISDNSGNALYHYDVNNDSWEKFPVTEDFPFNGFVKLQLSNDGKAYLLPGPTLYQQIAVFEQGQWDTIGFNDVIWDMAFDAASNALWVSLEEGIWKIQGEERELYNADNSVLPVDFDINGSFCQALQTDHSGRLWVGCSNRLFYFDESQFKEHNVSPASMNYVVTRLRAVDENSVLTMNAYEAFYHLSSDEILADFSDLEFGNYLPTLNDLTLNTTRDELILGTLDKLFIHNIGLDSMRVINKENSLIPDSNPYFTVANDRNGEVWAAGKNFLFKIPNLFD